MTILISKISVEDIDFIKNLELENNLSSWSIKDYKEEIDRPNSISLIITKDKCKCGFLIGRLINIETKREAEIYNIAIAKKFQNKSLGTTLLKEFIKMGQQNKLENIFLEVRESNYTAINFYRKNNFVEIGKRPNFYNDPLEDGILMCLSFKTNYHQIIT